MAIEVKGRRSEDGAGMPVRRVRGAPGPVEKTWPFTIPAVRSVTEDGLDLGRLTILVGENGAGKSTLVEGIALAYGMSAEGGSTGARHSSRPSESALHEHLVLERGFRTTRHGFFLRAETMHGFYTYLEDNPGTGPEPAFHEMSHGESFLEVLAERFDGPGLYLLDEPESALSFRSSLALVALLGEMARSRTSQAIVATHSPIIAATPGAHLYEVGEWGLRRTDWQDLDLVRDWRAFLADPELYLRHL